VRASVVWSARAISGKVASSTAMQDLDMSMVLRM